MIVVVLAISILIIGAAIGAFFLVHRHKSTTKVKCQKNSDCQSNQVCSQGYCCTPNCTDKLCSSNDGCGGNCNHICPFGSKCQSSGDCCTSQCDGVSCGQDDGCGATCGCSDGKLCHQGKCCQPRKCQGGVCFSSQCGQSDCKCQQDIGTCTEGKCSYSDICTLTNDFGIYLRKEWADYCSKCQNCQLQQADFENQALAPVAGIINCEKCQNSQGHLVSAAPVTIDRNVGKYTVNSDGQIVGLPNDCAGRTCVSSADCSRFDCGSNCTNFVCG